LLEENGASSSETPQFQNIIDIAVHQTEVANIKTIVGDQGGTGPEASVRFGQRKRLTGKTRIVFCVGNYYYIVCQNCKAANTVIPTDFIDVKAITRLEPGSTFVN
jgi:hypothetical protein